MNHRWALAVLTLISILPSLAAQTKPPAVYVDRGACPFECCTYRTWKTEKDTVAYAQPNKNSQRVGILKAHSKVVALTGEVRTRPGKFTIVKPHDKFKPGDVLWVYTPLGEGFYKVWFKGKMIEQELDYMSGPFEQTYPRCEDTKDCWGRLDTPLHVDWWVKIKSKAGWVGWTNETDNFSNQDACG
jgi:hypothetical protein